MTASGDVGFGILHAKSPVKRRHMLLSVAAAQLSYTEAHISFCYMTLRAQRLKKINLDWKFQSRLKISISIEKINPGAPEFPTKKRVCWGARLKFSISIENFNPGGRSWIFSIFGPLGESRFIFDLQQMKCIRVAIGNVGFGKRGLLEKGLFRKVDFLEILENLEIFENPQTCGKQRRIRPFSRDSREFRDSRDSSSEKTPFVMTPFSVPGNGMSTKPRQEVLGPSAKFKKGASKGGRMRKQPWDSSKLHWCVTFSYVLWYLSGPLSRDTAILSLRYPISRDTF